VVRFFYVQNFGDAEFCHSEWDFCDHWFTDSIWESFDLVQKVFPLWSQMASCSIKFFQLNFFFVCVFLSERFFVEEVFEMGESSFRLCNNHESISFFIQSMEESCSDEIADRWQIFVSMIKKSYN